MMVSRRSLTTLHIPIHTLNLSELVRQGCCVQNPDGTFQVKSQVKKSAVVSLETPQKSYQTIIINFYLDSEYNFLLGFFCFFFSPQSVGGLSVNQLVADEWSDTWRLNSSVLLSLY